MPIHLHLRAIDKNNIRHILALKTAPAQQKSSPSVGDMIARASVEENAYCYAIYAGGESVGFVKTWEDNRDEPDLWGLMIDEKHQGKGYGTQAVELVIAEIKTRLPAARRLCVGFLAKDGNARAFYEKCGFVVERTEQFDGWVEEIAYRMF